jgi:hypothetical protein
MTQTIFRKTPPRVKNFASPRVGMSGVDVVVALEHVVLEVVLLERHRRRGMPMGRLADQARARGSPRGS